MRSDLAPPPAPLQLDQRRLEGWPVWRNGLDGQNQAKLDTLGSSYRQVAQWSFKGLTLTLYER